MFINVYTLSVIILLTTQIVRSLATAKSRVEVLKERLRSRRHVGPTLSTDDYYSYEEMMEYLQNLASAYSRHVVLQDVGTTYENRTLRTVTITNGDGRIGKNAIFVAAAAHAREWLTPVAALYAVERLVVDYEQHAHLLQDYDWIVMPLANPDGYMYSRTTDQQWRNTRSPNGGNCFGTNIDRNFDIDWRHGYPELTDPCTTHYAGPEPFSAPEARAMRDIMQELVNTKRAVMYLALHSHHTSVFYPWAHKSSPTNNSKKLRDVAKFVVDAIRRATGTVFTHDQPGQYNRFGGTSLDYAFFIGFPLSFVLELPGDSFDFWPPRSMLTELAQESWVGISAMAEKAIEYYPLERAENSKASHARSHSVVNILVGVLLLALLTV